MSSAISITNVVKTFGPTRALDGLDLEVRTGEVHGFLGPNGAGKTVTIRILLGLLRADSGTVRLLDGDPWRDAVELHRHLAYVPGDVNLWPNLSGGETIDLLARLREGGGGTGRQAVDRARRDELIERLALDPTKKSRTYSKGNRQKVALIAGLSSGAELLLLDEPTSGLDPLMESVFQDCILEAHTRRSHGPAVEPHPRRGREAVRPGHDHPSGPRGAVRHARRDASPHPHEHQRFDRSADHRSGRARRRPRRGARRRSRAFRRGCRSARRDHPALVELRCSFAREPAADARRAVPASLRRRARPRERLLDEAATP